MTAAGPLVVVVQARMGSTRLPGKVLADIAGRTMLDRVVTRLCRTPGIDEVVVATSDLPQDVRIVEHGDQLGVRVVCGDPLDVLSRYALAARATAAGVVVRATADCPFIDPELTATVIDALTNANGAVDYASNAIEPRTYPRGLDVEVMTATALLEADELDRDLGSREHVTPFIRDSGRYRLAAVVNDQDLSAMRWTVDTLEDLELARLMATHVDGADDVSWRDLVAAWRTHPEWAAVNAHIEQKKVPRIDI